MMYVLIIMTVAVAGSSPVGGNGVAIDTSLRFPLENDCKQAARELNQMGAATEGLKIKAMCAPMGNKP